MNIQELAALMGKTIDEVKEILEQEDIIELKLSEKKNREPIESGSIELIK
tara:strand:+ start:1092 stop:1241 length:150 start_codon:yes stop_codon:yes gene_type:complete